MRKIQTTIYLEPDQYNDLMDLSAKTRIPFSTYIREGIDRVVKSNKGLLKGAKND